MPTPAEILVALRAAEEAGDLDAIDLHRAAYLEEAPNGPEAAEIQYRLGLSQLFRHQNTDEAMKRFKEAAGAKGAPFAEEARISYALCLLAKQKRQQAIFELRRLLPVGAPPSIHTAQALDFLALLLRESGASAADIARADAQRQEHLQALLAATRDPVEKAHFSLRLGAAYADGGTQMDHARARACFNDVLKLGPAAGDSALQVARAQLKALPR